MDNKKKIALLLLMATAMEHTHKAMVLLVSMKLQKW